MRVAEELKEFPQWVRSIMAARQVNQTQLAKDLGVSQATLSKWLSGQHPPSAEDYVKVQQMHERLVKPAVLKPRGRVSTQQVRRVPVVGFVGAGGDVGFGEGHGISDDDTESPDGATENTVAVEIRGDSMGPMFDRWLAFYEDRRDPPTEDLIGKVCVVGTADGRVLIKKLRRAKMRRRFDLVPQFGAPEENVEVHWAAKVIGLRERR
jgi:phage repressor protein C with HTH and peptisase S24 domain